MRGLLNDTVAQPLNDARHEIVFTEIRNGDKARYLVLSIWSLSFEKKKKKTVVTETISKATSKRKSQFEIPHARSL